MPKFNLELSIFNFGCIHSKRRKLGMFILYKNSQFINPNGKFATYYAPIPTDTLQIGTITGHA